MTKLSLLKLIENVGVTELRHFNHRSRGSLREMLLLIGNQIQSDIVSEIEKAGCFSIMINDTSDVSTTEQIICFVQYFYEGACKTNIFP